jgi:AraC-like DNA-binding protein
MLKTGRDLRKVVMLRAELEAIAIRETLGSAQRKQHVVAELAAIMRRMRPAARGQRQQTFSAADEQLHSAIVKAAGIPLLHELWRTAWDRMAEFHTQSLRECWPDLRVLLDEHEFLVEVIVAGDSVGAQDALHSHLDAIWYRLAEQRGEHSAPEDPLQRACAYLQFFFHRNVSLQQIAKGVAYLSPGHLSKLFRERYGVSFQSYLQRLRLNKAADLLIDTALPVALVARRSGYRDTSRFGQHFRREYGHSPLAWRKARRKNKKA